MQPDVIHRSAASFPYIGGRSLSLFHPCRTIKVGHLGQTLSSPFATIPHGLLLHPPGPFLSSFWCCHKLSRIAARELSYLRFLGACLRLRYDSTLDPPRRFPSWSAEDVKGRAIFPWEKAPAFFPFPPLLHCQVFSLPLCLRGHTTRARISLFRFSPRRVPIFHLWDFSTASRFVLFSFFRSPSDEVCCPSPPPSLIWMLPSILLFRLVFLLRSRVSLLNVWQTPSGFRLRLVFSPPPHPSTTDPDR